jgi:N-acetylmuramoyl-L-alanine amidase
MTETITKDSDALDVVTGTLYAEARGEPVEVQEWVVWVIKNRAMQDKAYWGGSQIKEVCLHPGQFECWNFVGDITMPESSYKSLRQFVATVLADRSDPTGGCDHYNNPNKEGYSDWTKNCKLNCKCCKMNLTRVKKIANHQFYKSKFS